VGTVDSTRDFDRRFRPTSSRVRERWERLALAQRRGESIPPIDVYRVGELHFVVDGHHRVSIALATGQKTIDAYVTEILTAVPARGIRRRGDLLYKSYERLFRSRVKLSAQAYAKITFSDPWGYAELGEAVEAWGFRLMQHEHKFYDRTEVSRRWFTDEYTPVVRLLRAADLVGSGTDADAYLTIARERYRLIRTHDWNDEVIEELQRQFRARWRILSSIAAPHPQEKDSGAVADELGAAAAEPVAAADEPVAAADEQGAAAQEDGGTAADKPGAAAAEDGGTAAD
jgi:hypothetical protein